MPDALTTTTPPPHKPRMLFLSAITLCTIGLLFGLSILYTDMYVDEAKPRYGLAAALALPSLAIGIVLFLNRRVRNLQREQASRLEALDRNGERMAQFVMSLVGELEDKIHKETASQLRSALGDGEVPPTGHLPGTGPLMRSTLELISSSLLHPTHYNDARRILPPCRDFALQLENAGFDDLAGVLSERLDHFENDVLEDLRRRYLRHLDNREWIAALEVSETIETVFTSTPLARDVEQMRPSLVQAIQDDIIRRRSGRPPSDRLSTVDLELSDQVAESA